MVLLLYPTHRKFIKLLRKQINNGNEFYLTKDDINDIHAVFNATTLSTRRHQIVYKTFIRAIKRSSMENQNLADVITVDSIFVDNLAKVFRRLEFNNPLRTIKNIVLIKIIRILHTFIRWLDKR